MYAVPANRPTPLWLIFIGIVVIMLTPQPAFWGTQVYTTSRGCTQKVFHIGEPPIYSTRQSSCSGQTTTWHWGAISGIGGGALTVASVATNAVAERRRGAGWRQHWLAALIVTLSLGGLTAFCYGMGSSMDCFSPEGMCGMALLIWGGIGSVAAMIGLCVTLAAWKIISPPIRAIGLGTLPAMLALWIIILH